MVTDAPEPISNDPLAHVPAWISGAAGGAVASLGQFVGSTLSSTLDFFYIGESQAAMNKLYSFGIGAIIMAACGAVVAFFLQSRTQNRWALFLAGAAATSIGTTALPGFAKLVNMVDIAPISIAHAADQTSCNDSSNSIISGVKQFFGLDTFDYRVVVGSFKSRVDAEALANKINATDSSLRAFVGDKAPCNDFSQLLLDRPRLIWILQSKFNRKCSHLISFRVLTFPNAPISYWLGF